MEASKLPNGKRNLLINRNFGWLWTGQAVSILGDLVYETALILWIATVIAHNQPWAPVAVGGILVITALPTLLLRPFIGVFVDRWDKRQTMLQMDAIRAILIALLILLTGHIPFFGGNLQVAWQLGIIYGIVFLANTCAQFFNPSRLALTGDIVAEPFRGRAFGLDYLSENFAIVIGPVLATIFFFGAGVQWILLLNALSFVLSFLCVLKVRVSRPVRGNTLGEESHVLREWKEGIYFFLGNRILVTLLITLTIALLGIGALNTLNIFFVTQNLHASASFYSLLVTGVGIGSLAGAGIAAFVVDGLGAARSYWLSIVVIGILILVYARISSFLPALLVFAVVGLPQAVLNVAEGPLLLRATPQELVGRVSSVLQPIITLASLLSIALAGLLASTVLVNLHTTFLGIQIGPIDTIFTGAGLLVILAGLYAMPNLHTVAAEKTLEQEPPQDGTPSQLP